VKRTARDDGAAMVEFLMLAVVLTVPLVYVLLAVFDVQRSAYGANAAAREAARVFIRSDSTADGQAKARAAAGVALADHGLDLDDGSLSISCSSSPCLTPGGEILVRYRTTVGLPYLPSFFPGGLLRIPISAEHTQIVDRYSEVRP